jgi:hypothetical protein
VGHGGYVEWANIAENRSNSLQTRVSAAVEMWPPYLHPNYYKYSRYIEALGALLKYLNAGK